MEGEPGIDWRSSAATEQGGEGCFGAADEDTGYSQLLGLGPTLNTLAEHSSEQDNSMLTDFSEMSKIVSTSTVQRVQIVT